MLILCTRKEINGVRIIGWYGFSCTMTMYTPNYPKRIANLECNMFQIELSLPRLQRIGNTIQVNCCDYINRSAPG